MKNKINDKEFISYNNEITVLKLDGSTIKQNIYNNKKYNFFVCDTLIDLQILSGWKYVEDALDDLRELKELYDYHCRNEELKIYTREYIKSLIK